MLVSHCVAVYGMMYGSVLSVDTETRAYVIAVYTDLLPALVCPATIFYSAPTIRRRIHVIMPRVTNVSNKVTPF